ncbi:Actin-like protein 6B [Podochytrium sp. JEL0797]|nr:Actin-like protein 6B [Podochytrium sp. JEL0797]
MAFGQDDTSSVVFDIGSSQAKVGFAGEEAPRAALPAVALQDGRAGEGAVFNYSEGAAVSAAVRGGVVADWDALSALWHHSFEQRLNVDPKEHPLLVSEPPWNTRDAREKMIELAFEKFQTPAFYIAKSPTLSAFSAGRPTALVIDSGADYTSVVPVVDGFVLKKAIQKSPIAGTAISAFAKSLLEANHINVVPHYMIRNKRPVDAGQKPPQDILLNTRVASKSFHDLAVDRVLHEFKETVFEVAPYGFQQQQLQHRTPKAFEFPDGYNNSFGTERFRIPEIVFTPALNPKYADGSVPGMQQMVISSLNACDPEIRAALFANVVVCGGNSMTPGFVDRLNNTLSHNIGIKHRIHPPGSALERKYAAWVGGSILGSLGNFQQMWISKAEYEEKGVSVEKRLP